MEPRNVLVQYEGGGYDGCFWEYNYFIVDKQGKFHDVASSGYKGADTEEKAKSIIDDAELEKRTFIYDLSDDDDINDFQANCNEGHVIGVTRKIAELIDSGVDVTPVWYICDKCGKKFYRGGHGDNYSGDGGIGITYHSKVCDDCYFFSEEDDD